LAPGSTSFEVNGTTFEIPAELFREEKKPPTVDVITSSSLTSQQPPMNIPTSQVDPLLRSPVIEGEKEILEQEAPVIESRNEDPAEQRGADWASQQPPGASEEKEASTDEKDERLQVISAKITERGGDTNIKADSGKGSALKTILLGKKPDGIGKAGGDDLD
jgi:hypothetical protein